MGPQLGLLHAGELGQLVGTHDRECLLYVLIECIDGNVQLVAAGEDPFPPFDDLRCMLRSRLNLPFCRRLQARPGPRFAPIGSRPGG